MRWIYKKGHWKSVKINEGRGRNLVYTVKNKSKGNDKE